MIFLKKKRIVFLLIFCLLFTTSCRGKSAKTAYDLYSVLENRLDIPESEIFTYVPDTSHNALMARLYGEKSEAVPAALAFCDDYCLCLYKGNGVWELHIFRTVSIYDNKKVVEMLTARRDLLQSSENSAYYDDTTQERIASAQILTHKNFVVLALTDDNECVKDALERFL